MEILTNKKELFNIIESFYEEIIDIKEEDITIKLICGNATKTFALLLFSTPS